MIHQIINALKAQNYVAVSKCFENSPNSAFIDYGPACVGKESFHVYGSTAIELFFRNKFYNNDFSSFDIYSISQERIEDEKSATYFCCYEGQHLYVRLTIEKIGESGYISKAVVRPE